MIGKATSLTGFENIKERVLQRIVPDTKEETRVWNLVDFLCNRISEIIIKTRQDIEVRVDGSVAKNTWLKGEADIDIFLRVSPEKPRSFLENECLEIARQALGTHIIVERFAEHPYIESSIDGLRLNIVPCYKVEKGEWLSATDRTPYHTEYMKLHLTPELQNEVRLLKKLLKASDLYGAEVKTKGFSGFLCEILTLYYKSFYNALTAASDWRSHQLIDIENSYKGRGEDLPPLFQEPLIVIDPIDKARNVASAVSPQAMWEFVALSRRFLSKPHFNFFFPRYAKSRLSSLKKSVQKIDSDLIALYIRNVNAVIDVLWSQLYKTERVLHNILEKSDFQVLRTKAWANDEGDCAIIFELESILINNFSLHKGPPVFMKESSERFLNKHLNIKDHLSGPWIEVDRWMIKRTRKHTNAVDLLKTILKDGGLAIGVPSKISTELSKRYKILVNEEILDLCKKDDTFRNVMNRFLDGRPAWLGRKR